MSSTFVRSRLALGIAGLTMVGASLLGASGAEGAPAGASDGSDWGPQGILGSDSPVTAQWDNTGNADTSVVPRNQQQLIPHTDGKNYFDISDPVLDAYADHFGKDNGLGGLRVSVSQTSDLVNQAVTVDIAGADPDFEPGGGSDSRTYFQVFQCWGAPGTNGQPDPDATSPDPETCQVGASGPDSVGGSTKREYRVVGGDPLVRGGDWEQYDSTGLVEVPFLSITGEESGANLPLENTFFNKTTTNELSHVVLPESGATQRQFEVQTGAESQGLGCGKRQDSVSTSTCWLVVVPRIQGVLESQGPTSPSVWAQRMQVQLGFRDVVLACSGGSRSLLGGSEMAADAAASWIPGVCDDEGVSLGYTRLGDEVARNQYAAGSSDAVLVSQPVPSGKPAIHVPLVLTAPVIAFNIDYQPVCADEDVVLAGVRNDTEARACGYADLAELRADLARSGQPVRDLRLNARLVAKLLTQSYQNSMINCGPDCTFAVSQGTMPQWSVERPTSLTDDPEFRALNPGLHLRRDTSVSEPILEAARSDAAAAVWRYLLADPESASFLAGCPDDDGVVVNPFYSSRTYTGCQDRRAELDAAATANRQATTSPDGFVDAPVAYPPDGSPFPLPGWQEQPATGDRPARTLVDHLPRVDVMQIGARDAFIGLKPRNSDFCEFAVDPTCFPAPGKWKDPKTLQRFGERQVLTLTDAPSAARFKLPTARLCDDFGEHCAGADTGALQAAAADFTTSAVAGVRAPATQNDYAGGAYPLTLPVYAAVRPSLGQDARGRYATAFDFVTGDGQRAGFASGDLPPGYAPLTANLRGDAAAAIRKLRQATPAVEESASASASAEPSETASESPSAEASPSEGGNPEVPGLEPVPGAETPTPTPGAAATPGAPTTVVETMPVAASTEEWSGYLLPLGLALTIAAGVTGPVMRRRHNWRLR